MKKLASTLCICLVLSLLCAGMPAFAGEALPEPLEIYIIGQAKPDWGGVDNNKLFAAIEEAANVRFTFEIPPTTGYVERLNIVMSSGDFPDVLKSAANDSFRNWSDSGLLLPLDDYLADCPNITAMVPEHMYNLSRNVNDGLIYGIPVTNPSFLQGVMWRMDWLRAGGIDKVPETLDEFIAAWDYLSNGDPDGNGKKDTYGFSSYETLNVSGSIFTALGTTAFDAWKVKDGAVYYGLQDENYLEGVRFLKDMYDQGYLDQEFILVKKEEDHELRFSQGIVGSVFVVPTVANWTRVKQKTEQAFEGAEVAFGPAPSGADGVGRSNVSLSGNMGLWALTVGAKQPERIMEFFNFMHQTDWYFAQANGVEGVHYESYDPVSEQITRTDEQKALWALDYNPQMWFSRDPLDVGFYSRTVSYKPEEFKEAFSYNNKTEYYDADISYGFTPGAMRELENNIPGWKTTVYELQNKIIMGSGSESDLTAFIEKLNNSGLNDAVTEMQAYYDANN